MTKNVKHSRDTIPSTIEVLNDTSLQLLEIKDELEIYKIFVSAISRIIPGIYCFVSKLQPDDMNFRVVQSYGLDNFMKSIKSILGKDPYTMDFPFKDLSEKHRDGFMKREFYHLEDGLYGLSVGAIDKKVCKAIEKLLGISDIFATSFYIEDHYFGGFSMLVPKRVMKSGILNQESIKTIETLSNLASVLIQKLRFNQELTESRKKLETSVLRSNLLISNLTDIAWRANGDGSCVEDLNNSFESIYGFTADAFIQNPNLWKDLAAPEDRDIVNKLNDDLFQNGKAAAEYRVIRPDGKITWLHDRVSIINDEEGNPIMLGGIAKDITQQKEMELKLQELISAKDKFFSIIAHDLKSPFNAIIGLTDILANEYENTSEKNRRMYIHMLRDSAANTYKLLENLLEYSRLSLGNHDIHRRMIALKAPVEDCIALYSATAESKKISIINTISEETTMFIDEHSLHTILRNLLNNAIKYTLDGGCVTFTSKQETYLVELSVQDTGVGIKKEMIQKLFDISEKTSTPGTKMEKGTGLGLILCKELIEMNGGSIRVESELEKGSIFTITMPTVISN